MGLMFLPRMQYIFVQTCLFLQFLKLPFCLDTVSQKCRLGNVLAIKVGKCFSHKSKAFSGDVLVNILLHTEGSCRQGRKGSSAHL